MRDRRQSGREVPRDLYQLLYDPPKAKEAAFAMIDKGADILYAERFGVSDAAKEKEILAIGNVIDTSADYPGTILSSALWQWNRPSIAL